MVSGCIFTLSFITETPLLMQTVKILIMRRLICVCQCPFYRTLGINGLSNAMMHRSKDFL